MEVILLERVAKLGQMGDVVKVKDGFARNFLLPQGRRCAPPRPTRRASSATSARSKRAIASAARKPKAIPASSTARAS